MFVKLSQYKYPILIILTAIFSIAGYVNHLINQPLEILSGAVVPTEFTYNNEKIALAWTDDNTGETLIIKSDKKEYSGFNQADVYFSITNISNKDQDADIMIWLEEGKSKAEKVERINEDGSSFQFSISNFQSISNDQFPNRKKIGGSAAGYAINDKIKSGLTNYYKATLKYPPMSKGEFFIEAVGSPTSELAGIKKYLSYKSLPNIEGEKALRAQRGLLEPQAAYGLLDPWYSSNWSYRRAITLQGSKIATTTTGFPVLATTTLADLKTTTNGGKVGNASGYDIVFTDSDGSTLLNYEREKYVATTGEIAYWIKTDIASSTDKTIYMYYGNAGASDTATTTGVWDSNYVMVNHLANNGVATTTYPDFNDSTKYANNGSSVNMNSADLVNGWVDGALDFDGVDDWITTTLNWNFCNNNCSISVWAADILSATTWHAPVGGSTSQYNAFFFNTTTIYLRVGNIQFSKTSPVNLSANILNHIVVTKNGTTGEIFINGNSIGTGTVGGTPTAINLVIGMGPAESKIAPFNGLIDEVRVSNTARTAGWITTEYNNQSSVGSFMTIGAEEGKAVTKINSPQTNLMKSGLVGYWSFNGQDMNWASTTAEALDRSGNNNNGNVINGAKPVSGISGQALQFDGVNGDTSTRGTYVNAGSAASLDVASSSDFSFSAWFKTNIGAGTSQGVIGKGEKNTDGIFLGIQSNRINFFAYTAPSTQAQTLSDAAPVAGVWYHAVGVRENGTNYLYVNGVKQADHDTIGFVDSSSRNLFIGRLWPESVTYTLNGIIDEVRVYNRALSADEIGELYRSGAKKMQVNAPQTNLMADDGLVGYWSFNGADMNWASTTAEALDRSGNSNNGNVINGAKPVSGISGQAMQFDGVDDYIQVPHNTILEPVNISVSAWVNANSWDPHGRYDNIVEKMSSNSPYPGYALRNEYGVLEFQARIDGVNFEVTAPTLPLIKIWHHILATYDGETMKLYVDGIEVDSDTSPSGSIEPSGAVLRIGESSALAGRVFNGSIDEARIYNRALSAEEIGELYRAGARKVKY